MRVLPAFALCALGLAVILGAARASRLAGPEVRVSSLPGPQSEVNVAIDPKNDQILLAGSNSFSEGTMRLYGSTDGGVTWTTTTAFPPPRSLLETCAADPWAGIDLDGRQYFSFVRSTPCRTGPPRLYVVTRAGPTAPWGKPILVARLGRRMRFDDKPALAVDTSPASRYRNRVYVAWSRVSRIGVFSIVLSHSDDDGRTWSRPVKVNRGGREVTYASIAVSRNGTVYLAWDDVTNFGLKIARSTDGGAHFGSERKFASFVAVTIPHCGTGIVIPAQRRTCVHANPIVSVDTSRTRSSGRVYVSYAKTEFRGSQLAHVAVFNSRLRRLGGDPETGEGVPVTPARRGERDQFWPHSAVDPATGALWVCFYDTGGDPERKQAFYSCTVSLDGGRKWTKLVRAATVPSDETQPEADRHEYGDYEGLAVANGVAHPIWTDSRDLATLGEEIYTTRLTLGDLGLAG